MKLITKNIFVLTIALSCGGYGKNA